MACVALPFALQRGHEETDGNATRLVPTHPSH